MTDRPAPIHIYPLQDFKAHLIDGQDCWCDPQHFVEMAGQIFVIHHSADHRERYEIAPEKIRQN